MRRCISFFALVGLCLLLKPVRTTNAAEEWLPVDPAELKMTDDPKAPGAQAIYLYRQVDRDDAADREVHYLRIKILTEEGRKNADIEIPVIKGDFDIEKIKARTIQPDGSIVNFDGKIYEKTIVKVKGAKYLARTFTLPDVRVGSIIEYRYVKTWPGFWLSNSNWILSQDLFTKHAKFSLKPYPLYVLRYNWRLLPPGSKPAEDQRHFIRMEVNDIPAFQREDFMPPEDELKARVDFIYTRGNRETEPAKFWKQDGKLVYDSLEEFLNKKKEMERAVSEIVAPADAPEVKLRKIYARVQQLRNTSFEAEKTEKEKQREKQKEINNIADVWKNSYGTGRELTWLFLGLVRAADFEAYPILVSRRDYYLFNPDTMNPFRLDDNVVLVKFGGKNLYFDPGTAFTPYGLLPWAETAVSGFKLEKDGGTWVTTTLPDSSVSQVQRKGELKLDEQGTLEGKITVTYTGLEALRRRLQERNEDDADKKKYLEDELKGSVPVAVDVELTNQPDWKSSSDTLIAVFDFKAQGWASSAGPKILVPVGLFSASEKHLFEHADRAYPLYCEYPSEVVDDIKIDMPLSWIIKSLPPLQNQDAGLIAYKLKVEDNKGIAQISRFLKVNVLTLDLKYYAAIRNFYQGVKNGDEQQIVVQPG